MIAMNTLIIIKYYLTYKTDGVVLSSSSLIDTSNLGLARRRFSNHPKKLSNEYENFLVLVRDKKGCKLD